MSEADSKGWGGRGAPCEDLGRPPAAGEDQRSALAVLFPRTTVALLTQGPGREGVLLGHMASEARA